MNLCAEQRALGVASTSGPTSSSAFVLRPCLTRSFRKGQVLPRINAHLGQAQAEAALLTSARPRSGSDSSTKYARHGSSRRLQNEESVFPLYTCLDNDVLTPANKFAYFEALRSGLKALRAVGVNGICVDVYWGIVEAVRPMEYDWSSYRQLFDLIRDEGFIAQVCLCFHANELVPLPAWVLEAGRSNPDIFYTDRGGVRNTEYISLGVDEVPVLAGRSAVQCYRDFMASFRWELGHLLGGLIGDVIIGLGPNGELKYPAHPSGRWTFPGVGEFQCYDRYMLSSLGACAHRVSQPHWGLKGPHDAGSYCMWPHQTGFFHQKGNWTGQYGRFFLQWYCGLLLQHADGVLAAAVEELLDGRSNSSEGGANLGNSRLQGSANSGNSGGPQADVTLPPSRPGSWAWETTNRPWIWTPQQPQPPHSAVYLPGGQLGGPEGNGGGASASGGGRGLRLHAKVPSVYWWYHTESHAPELTAGIYNTVTRDGYLPIMKVLESHGVCARLRGAELQKRETLLQAHCGPEWQLLQIRTTAAAVMVPMSIENSAERFDEVALSRLETALFENGIVSGIELPQVKSLVFNRMCDAMFEPGNWCRFKDFVQRVRDRADALATPKRGPQQQQPEEAEAAAAAGVEADGDGSDDGGGGAAGAGGGELQMA